MHNAIQPLNEKYFEIFFLPLFKGNFHSAFLLLMQLLYATYHIASICWAYTPSIPHTAIKSVIAIMMSAQ